MQHAPPNHGTWALGRAGPSVPGWAAGRPNQAGLVGFENQKLAKATFEQLAAYVFPLCIVSLAGPFFGLLKLQIFSWIASLGV